MVICPNIIVEVLTLYTHLRSNPIFVYKNNVMDADFKIIRHGTKDPDPEFLEAK